MEPVYHLTKHLQDAIVINSKRKPIYAKLTKGKSSWLSCILIFAERVSCLFSRSLDKAAIPFQRNGISIIANDFVSMDTIKSHTEKPVYQKLASNSTFAKLRKELAIYRKQIASHLKKDHFKSVAKDSYDLLARIKTIEVNSQSHFGMTCHIIESIGLTALNAVGYSEKSSKATNALSKKLINFQKIALWSCLYVDKQAQKIHQHGVGIIVNDIPHIPFEEQWLASSCFT